MTFKFYFLVLIVPYFAVSLIAEEEGCTPGYIRHLSVSDELMLIWEPSTDDCPLSHYIVHILNRGVETVYTTEETSMNITFLPTCERATFVVIPVSTENIQGGSHSLGMQLPVPPGANVSIEHASIRQQGDGVFLLSWALEEEYQHCSNRFRVLIHNEDYNDAVDLYVQSTSAVLEHILPCEDYTFGVRAIHTLVKEGPIFLMKYTTPSARMVAPALQSISLAATSVDLEWQLESYAHNRCPVSSITVDGSPYLSAAYPIRDDPVRPLLSTNITGLQPNTMYFLNVSVVNSAGPSVPHLIAVQTLEDS